MDLFRICVIVRMNQIYLYKFWRGHYWTLNANEMQTCLIILMNWVTSVWKLYWYTNKQMAAKERHTALFRWSQIHAAKLHNLGRQSTGIFFANLNLTANQGCQTKITTIPTKKTWYKKCIHLKHALRHWCFGNSWSRSWCTRTTPPNPCPGKALAVDPFKPTKATLCGHRCQRSEYGSYTYAVSLFPTSISTKQWYCINKQQNKFTHC